MTDEGVVVLGIPIPSSSPMFLSIVAVHVAAGLTCTVAGIVAMLAPKRSGRHPSAGTVYYWSLVVVFLSMAALSILRWPANTHLFVLGVLSFSAGVVGRMAKRRLGPGWLRVHMTGMGLSYILLLTAFYVGNGPPARSAIAPASALKALNREIILRASDREVNAPEETHLEVVRHVAAVRPTPRRWIDVRAVI
jgi:hypothetical protein